MGSNTSKLFGGTLVMLWLGCFFAMEHYSLWLTVGSFITSVLMLLGSLLCFGDGTGVNDGWSESDMDWDPPPAPCKTYMDPSTGLCFIDPDCWDFACCGYTNLKLQSLKKARE